MGGFEVGKTGLLGRPQRVGPSDGQLPTRNGTVRAPAGARGCMLVLSLPVGLRLIQVLSVRPPQPWCGGQLLRCAQEAPTRIRTARPPQGQVERGPLRARPSLSINFELAIEGSSMGASSTQWQWQARSVACRRLGQQGPPGLLPARPGPAQPAPRCRVARPLAPSASPGTGTSPGPSKLRCQSGWIVVA
jgi:hypothetical protein